METNEKKAFLEELQKTPEIYVIMSVCTKMPYVYCEPESYDDQVFLFHKEEDAKKLVEDYRQPTDNVLFPSAFVKLILQYFYYDIWKQKIMQGDFQDCLIERIEREIIGRQYWGIDEMKIPYISCSGHKN